MATDPAGWHAIPYQDKFIIYRPLRPLAFIGNAAMVDYVRERTAAPDGTRLPDVDAYLKALDFARPDVPPAPLPVAAPHLPTTAVLLMTTRCNLACRYCYAAGGGRGVDDMPGTTAALLIDTVCDNARRAGRPQFSLCFHGGGEPTLHWDVLARAVEQARAKDLPCEVSLTSNGLWTEAQTAFVCAQCDSLTISFDGVRAVQDAQRPRRDGSGSYDAVVRSLAALDRHGKRYGVRMTVTPDSVDRLPESVAWLCAATRAGSIQIEASFTARPGVYTDVDEAFAPAFVERFLEAAELAARRGILAFYSGARPWVIARTFCQAARQALIATPEGRLVACFEAAHGHHPYADAFAIGQVRNGKAETFPELLRAHEDRLDRRRLACRDCFCYWHCHGDCASRAMASPAPDSVRCRMNREITKALIVCGIAQGDGIWRGTANAAAPAAHPHAPPGPGPLPTAGGPRPLRGVPVGAWRDTGR